MKKQLSLILVPFVFFLDTLSLEANKLFDKTARKQLIALLLDNCNWLAATDPNAQAPKDPSGPAGPLLALSSSIRALTLGSELSKASPQFLQEAQRRCEVLAAFQKNIRTSKGRDGGFWIDPGTPDTLDLGVLGTAATSLGRASVSMEGPVREATISFLERYARFLIEGCQEDPAGKGRGGTTGWILREGEQKGAMGGGYTKDRPMLKQSTVSTAANAGFLAQLYALTKNAQYRDLAEDAVRWLLKSQRGIGDIPTLMDGTEISDSPMRTFQVAAEALMSVYYLCGDASFNQQILKESEPMARWLVRSQNENGLWGNKGDRRASAAALTFLAWFSLNGAKKDEAFSQSVDKAWQTLSNPVHAQSLGVQISPYTTALVAATTAEMIKPGISFKRF